MQYLRQRTQDDEPLRSSTTRLPSGFIQPRRVESQFVVSQRVPQAARPH
jgi:hypothetical protein